MGVTYPKTWQDYEQDFVWSEGIIIVEEVGNCAICKKKTFFAEVNFETFICSPECEDSIWEEYWEALGRRYQP